MKKSVNPELARTINRQAHILAALSFPAIRTTLEENARAMLRDGRSLEDTLREIKAAGLRDQYAQACAPVREAADGTD